MKKTLTDKLWTRRSTEETREIYAEWAGSYDSDLDEAGYQTPDRLAAALAEHLDDKNTPILDFGCGTGRSGLALRAAGYTTIDGTDITPEMLEIARGTGAYREIWVGEPGSMGPVTPGQYQAITATGVVSLGAAPPETLQMLLDALPTTGLVALSYNDATLADADYMRALKAAQSQADLIYEAYGPHLISKDMGSTVYVLRKH